MSNIFEDEVDCKRILREIYLLARLKNTFVVDLFDMLEPNDPESFDTIYVVLSMSESDLKKLIKSPPKNIGRNSPMPTSCPRS